MTTATITATDYFVHLRHCFADGELGSSEQTYRVQATSKELAVAKAYQKAYGSTYSNTKHLYIVTSVRKAPVRRNHDDD